MNSEIELHISSISTDGRGVSRASGEKTIFVEGAIPGEKVIAVIYADRKNFREATATKIITESPDRVAPRCAHYQQCGGCSLQHASLDAQRVFKKQWLLETLQRLGKWPQNEVEAAQSKLRLVEAEPWFYRQRIRVHATTTSCGFRTKRSHDIVNVEECSVAHSLIQKQWKNLVAECTKLPRGNTSREIEITVNSNNEITTELISERERIYRPSKQSSQVNLIPMSHPFARDFVVHRQSFVQPHKDAVAAYANHILEEIIFFARDSKLEKIIAWDLYAGSGPFSFLPALAGERLHLKTESMAVEGVGPAATALSINTQKYGVKCFTSDVNEFVLKAHSLLPNVVMLDPPRAGCGVATALSIAKKCAQESLIIYVACDAASLARDACSFLGQGFYLHSLSIYDTFAQTVHYETIAVFRRREK